VINKSIKFFVVFVISFNVFAGGDDRDDTYYANLDAELAAFEAQVSAESAAQEMMAEIETDMLRQDALDAFQQKLKDEKAAAAKSTAAYQSKRANDARIAALMDQLNTEKELANFEAQLEAELASQEMMAEIETDMARQAALDAFQQKIANEKAAAAKSTAAYQDSLLDAEFAALEAQIKSEADAAEMMAEIEREMALADFLQKLADEKAAAAASTAAYQASLADEEVIGVIEEVVVTEAAHEACKYALNLSESNVALFKSALADGSLFSVGPQSSNGTEFGASRWDEYANCVSNYVNPF
jgi:colicin import membrane protein